MESELKKVLLSPKSLESYGFKPHEATLERMIALLQLPRMQRNHKQVSVLQALTRKIKFFLQKVQELGEGMHFDSCKSMSYEFFRANEVRIRQFVFKTGDNGEKFYIILQGTVRVLSTIPNGQSKSMITIAQLISGMAFGELALIKDQPRSASIQCVTNCHFAVLNKDDYMKIIGKAEVKILDQSILFLKEIPFFSKWSKRKLEKLSYSFSSKLYQRKQIVFLNGSQANTVFIVKAGEFELTRPLLIDPSSKEKSFHVKVALLGRGEMFGEEEVINAGTYKSTCTCYSQFGELLMLTANDFLSRFYEQREPSDDSKRQLKYLIRESRIEHFKEFMIGKTINPRKTRRKKISNTLKIPAIRNRSEGFTESGKGKFSPLSTYELEKIKEKALAEYTKNRVYITFNTPYESLQTEEDSDCISSQALIDAIPFGYYHGKLRNPRKHWRNLTPVFN